MPILLLLACSRPPPAESVFEGGTIHVTGSTTDAVAVVGGEIVAIGEEAVASIGPDTERVDLAGAHAYPGFQDAHVHLIAGSFVMERLLMVGVSDVDKMAELVAEYAAEVPEEPWIVGYGWLSEGTESDPDGRALDAVAPDRPVLLVNNSGHSAIVNGVALARAGITDDTPDPEGGSIARDPETGEATGYLVENALSLVSDVALADYDDTQLGSGLAAALDTFSAGGLTGVAEIMASPGFNLARPWIYADLEDRGELPLRVHYYAPITALEDLAAAEELRGAYDGDLVRFAGAKLWVDGSMGSGEAWMSEPVEGGGTGTYYFDPAELVAIVREAEARGLSLKMHVSGDAAVTAAVDAFAVVAEESGLAQVHVLEHAVLLSDADRARMAELGIVASVQPSHYLGARLGDTADTWGDRFDDAYDFRAFVDAGVPLAMGTDWPVWPTTSVPVNLWTATQAAEGHSLTIAEAITGYAAGSALAVGMAGRLGCLDVGCAADLVILSADPAAVAIEEVSGLGVTAVWVAGRQVR